jgi:hypothetical protein
MPRHNVDFLTVGHLSMRVPICALTNAKARNVLRHINDTLSVRQYVRDALPFTTDIVKTQSNRGMEGCGNDINITGNVHEYLI